MPISATSRKTPAMASPPKTAPSCTDSHAYPVTHRKTNTTNTAQAAIADPMKKVDVTPVRAWIRRTILCIKPLSIRTPKEWKRRFSCRTLGPSDVAAPVMIAWPRSTQHYLRIKTRHLYERLLGHPLANFCPIIPCLPRPSPLSCLGRDVERRINAGLSPID